MFMERAAGIILFRMSGNVPEILCLKVYGHYDLPKGRIEGSETELEGALRETREETGIDDVVFPWGHINVTVKHEKRHKQAVLFLGSTKKEPQITKNPETGRFEHHGIVWLSIDEAVKKVHTYLRPALSWAQSILSRNLNV
jgi:8-oxo-dGTP pyrophosphatase MutT (NUDIX family)